MQPVKTLEENMQLLQNDLTTVLKQNEASKINQSVTEFQYITPTASYLQTNIVFQDMLSAFNILVIMFLFLLAAIVIYSLMISDVNEQTYQFAMMRALGFRKEHLVVFIVLQAFSFAIPGLILGLVIALLLNDGLRESFYLTLQLAGDYGLPSSSILLTTFMVGIVIPLISNMGPAQ